MNAWQKLRATVQEPRNETCLQYEQRIMRAARAVLKEAAGKAADVAELAVPSDYRMAEWHKSDIRLQVRAAVLSVANRKPTKGAKS